MAKTNVLFMQSQSFFGSDSMIHSLIMRHLDRSQFEVHVACNAGSKDEPSASLTALSKIPDLHVRPTNFGPTLTGRSKAQVAGDAVHIVPSAIDLLGLARYARRHHIDIVHGTEKPRDSFYGALLARACGARSITHIHVKVEDWISPLVLRSMHRNAALIGVSDFVADSAVAMGYDRSKVFSVLNSIDRVGWEPTPDSGSIRRELGIPEQTPIVSIISRLFPWKGHEILLHAAAKLKADGVDFRLLVVGEDDPRATPGGGSFLGVIKDLSTELGLDDRVIFTGFRTDVRELLTVTDVYAMPTFEEPCAVAFLEAMAMSKPVLALASGGTVQLVADGESGLLSEPGDVDGLADNLRSFLLDADLRRRFGAAGRRRVEELFYPQRLADDVADVYRATLARA